MLLTRSLCVQNSSCRLHHLLMNGVSRHLQGRHLPCISANWRSESLQPLVAVIYQVRLPSKEGRWMVVLTLSQMREQWLLAFSCRMSTRCFPQHHMLTNSGEPCCGQFLYVSIPYLFLGGIFRGFCCNGTSALSFSMPCS